MIAPRSWLLPLALAAACGGGATRPARNAPQPARDAPPPTKPAAETEDPDAACMAALADFVPVDGATLVGVFSRPSQDVVGGEQIEEEVACRAEESDDACLSRAEAEVAARGEVAGLQAHITGVEAGVTASVEVDGAVTRIDVGSWDELAHELQQLTQAGKTVVPLSGQVAYDPTTRKARVSGTAGGRVVEQVTRVARFRWPQPTEAASALAVAQQRTAEKNLSVVAWEVGADSIATLDVVCPPPR